MKVFFVWLTLLLYMLFYCLDYYFRISPSLIFSQLLTQYHTTAIGMGAFASAFYFGYLLMQIPIGMLLDKPYYRLAVITSILICSGAFIAFILLQQYWLGYLLRWIIGGTSAFSFICVLHVARHQLNPKWFGTIAGITIAAGTLAASFLQLGSAFLMQYFSWHQVFISIAMMGFGLSLILLLLLPFDKTSAPYAKPTRGGHWLRQIKQFSCQPRLLINGAIGGLFYLPTTLFATMWGIPFLQQTYHMSRSASSFGITLLFLGWAIGSPIVGFMMDRVTFYLIIGISGAFAAMLISLALVEQTFHSTTGAWMLLLLFGVCSSAQVIVWKYFSLHCPKAISGYGAAFTNMIMMLFAALFHLVVGYLTTAHAGQHELNYQHSLLIMPAALLLVILLTSLLMGIKTQRPPEEIAESL